MTTPDSPRLDSLHVAIVFHRSDVIGGASVYSLSIARGLRRRGHAVRLFVPGSGHFTDQLDNHGIEWQAVPGLGRTMHPGRNATALRSLRGAIEDYEPDLISAQASTAGALCRLLRRRVDLPVIYTPHSWSFAPGAPKLEACAGWLVEASLRGRADAVIAVSEFERNLGVSRRVLDPSRTHVIHNGVASVIAPRPVNDHESGPMRVVCIARFEAQKDHVTLLGAFARLNHHDVELILIGDGALLEASREQAEQLGISDRVQWTGALDDVSEHLRNADIFTLPSRWESLPLSIIEAMAAGLPVVATDVGGVAELVTDGHTGELVPPRDVDALAASLDRLLADRQLRADMGRAGRDRYEKLFTEDRMLELTLALYEQVAHGWDRA